MTADQLKYPIGKFQKPDNWTEENINQWIHEIDLLPGQLYAVIASLDERGLDQAYRSNGWTGRQVIHHIADSHMNSYIRFKLALTEDNPTIRPYDEKKWSELPDYRTHIYTVLRLIQALHEQWTYILRSIDPDKFDRTFLHPENHQGWSLGQHTALYAWHGRHHLGHLEIIQKMRSCAG